MSGPEAPCSNGLPGETMMQEANETHTWDRLRELAHAGDGKALETLIDGLAPSEAVRALLPRLRYAHRAANLGAVETVVGPPATTSHVECSPEERAAMGIPESLIRYSTGIEDADDLIDDLEQALAHLTVSSLS